MHLEMPCRFVSDDESATEWCCVCCICVRRSVLVQCWVLCLAFSTQALSSWWQLEDKGMGTLIISSSSSVKQ